MTHTHIIRIERALTALAVVAVAFTAIQVAKAALEIEGVTF